MLLGYREQSGIRRAAGPRPVIGMIRLVVVLLVSCLFGAPAVFASPALGFPGSHTQEIAPGDSLAAASCVPATSECVVIDGEGDAFYATNVSATAAATWKSWSGPASPSEAIACPASSLCVLAAGEAEEEEGGDVYYATSPGGTWQEAFAPVWGVDAISCPTSSFCLAGEGEGFIRYSTDPALGSWTSLDVATGEVNAVACLSASFCALADRTGYVYVADTEAKIKEEKGWKATDVDGSTALRGIACSAPTSCVAIDGSGDVLDLAIDGSGEATVSKEDIDGANHLTAITCTGTTCVAVDSAGNVLASLDGGAIWRSEYALGTDLTSVSCSGFTLCLATGTNGEVTAFEAAAPGQLSVSLDGSGAGTVASSPPGISCPSDCTYGYAAGSGVVLTATAAPGSTFAGWLGCKYLTATECEVTIGEASEVTAVFLKEAEAPLIAPFSESRGGCANGGVEVTVGGHATYTCNGIDGTNGAAGTNGTEGKESPPGREGPQGKEGPRGPAGPRSRVTCRVKQEGKQRFRVTCTVGDSASSSRVHLRWRLTRDGRTVNHGAGDGALRLDLRHLRPGSYLLYVQGQRHAKAITVVG